MALIKLTNVDKTYFLGEIDVPVLHQINLHIERGEYLALMGASGSGKSTLMNILGCLDRPTSGDYYLNDLEVGRLANNQRALVRNREIGFVFQSFNLLPRTSALENVIMPLTYTASDLSTTEKIKRGTEMLRKVGLSDRLEHHPSQLSGGQQQRVAIARALINRPPVLFADEPTGNLDSQTSAEVLQMFADLHRQDGITIIVVTHAEDIAQNAQRIIRIKDGKIL